MRGAYAICLLLVLMVYKLYNEQLTLQFYYALLLCQFSQ